MANFASGNTIASNNLSPSVLSPTVNINPSFNFAFNANADGSCSDCSPPSPTRIIPKGGSELTTENTNLFLKIIRSCCCCLGEDKQSQNVLAIQLYKQLLNQEYGKQITVLAIKESQIDLNEKENKGDPLFVAEAQTILNQAEKFKSHTETLNEMIKNLALYSEIRRCDRHPSKEIVEESPPFKHHHDSIEKKKPKHRHEIEEDREEIAEESPTVQKKSNHSHETIERKQSKHHHSTKVDEEEIYEINSDTDESDSSPPRTKIKKSRVSDLTLSDLHSYHVRKSNGAIEDFKPKAITRDLKKLPLNKTLSTEEIQAIETQVEKYLQKKNSQEVSTDTIRKVVARKLSDKKRKIPRPEFLSQIPDKDLAKGIRKKKSVQDLTDREYEALLKIAMQTKKIPSSKHTRDSDDEE